jgi:predicted cupin superfamily sugar epimerase
LIEPRGTAKLLIETLSLAPHPEGGWYRETYRHHPAEGGRGSLTLIYFLLVEGRPSAWHRIDAVESWHHYAGAALLLRVHSAQGGAEEIRLGSDVGRGERFHAVVPARAWQSAETTGEFTLVGCATAPAFEFAGFELAPPGFDPSPSSG